MHCIHVIYNEPYLFLLVLFPVTYIHFKTLSYDLLYVPVLFQWMDGLCAAVTELITITHLFIPHIFLNLCPSQVPLQLMVSQSSVHNGIKHMTIFF